jgi:hypothetical protein
MTNTTAGRSSPPPPAAAADQQGGRPPPMADTWMCCGCAMMLPRSDHRPQHAVKLLPDKHNKQRANKTGRVDVTSIHLHTHTPPDTTPTDTEDVRLRKPGGSNSGKKAVNNNPVLNGMNIQVRQAKARYQSDQIGINITLPHRTQHNTTQRQKRRKKRIISFRHYLPSHQHKP